MATLTASPQKVSLGASRGKAPDLQLDDTRLEAYSSRPGISLNGRVRNSTITGEEHDTAWLEPGPDVEPDARRLAGLRIRTVDGFTMALSTPIELFNLPQGQLIRAIHYTLTIAIGTTRDEHIVRWWLEPGGDNASLRADGLAFLQALHDPGELELVDESGSRIASLKLPQAQGFDPELVEALSFINEVAMLEEWTGQRIPLPLDVPATQVREVAASAAIVRSRVLPVTVGEELELTVHPSSDEPFDVDTVIVPQQVSANLVGVEVSLGTAELVVAVDVTDQQRAADDLLQVRCRLHPDQPRSFSAHLYPPTTRSRQVRRTLVGAAPIPFGGPVSAAVAADLRQAALTAFLEEELQGQDLPEDLLADVRAKWPE